MVQRHRTMPLRAGRVAAAVVLLGIVATVLVAVVTVPGLTPPGEMLQLDVGHRVPGQAAFLAEQEYESLSDESSGILGSALSALASPKVRFHLQTLNGFTPETEEDESLPETAHEIEAKKRAVYRAQMGDHFRNLFGDTDLHGNETEVDHALYGNARVPTGWHYQGPTAHPTKIAPVRRKLGYNRMAPFDTGDFYRQYNPYRSVYGPNSTLGVYHPPGFDNTYQYSMPNSSQWIDSQKRASSNGGFFGLMRHRWPKGKAGHRWKSMSPVSALKTSGDQSAWPQKANWNWNHWDAIPDPQRAHEETVGSLDPESEANLQLTYGRMYPQWTPSQKFGGVNGDKFLPYDRYKHQLNQHHPKDGYGFKYLKGKYYKKQYKDLVQGSAIDKLDNSGWGVVDKRVPVKTAVDEQAPEWLRKLRSNTGEPIGDVLNNFWQGGGLVDAAPGGGGRSDVLGFKEGKAGELLEDHHGWLQDAPKGHLVAFRGRRPEPDDEESFNQNEFDPGESFSTKAKGLSQLALKRKELLREGRHVEQKLKIIDTKMRLETAGAKHQPAPEPAAASDSAFNKANAAFFGAMAAEAGAERAQARAAGAPRARKMSSSPMQQGGGEVMGLV